MGDQEDHTGRGPGARGYLEQVVEPPGQDHDVVDVEQRHDHHGCVADSCIRTHAQ